MEPGAPICMMEVRIGLRGSLILHGVWSALAPGMAQAAAGLATEMLLLCISIPPTHPPC